MLQNNAKVRKFSKFLITCSFLSFLVGEANAEVFADVFEDDSDVQKTLSGNIRDVLKEKAVNKRNAYKLSDKGDLRANDGRVFREFLMVGDGNCALYSMGTNHAAAKALFLANAQNQIVRDLAHQEIVDEFHKLPSEMKAKQRYVELKNSLDDILGRLAAANVDETDLRADIIALRDNLISEEEQIRQEIQNYAMSEEAYTDYVNYALVNGHYMRFRQEVGGDQRTYFIDALAYLLNKNLTIWSQVDCDQRTIEKHPGCVRDDTYLIPSHSYEGAHNDTLNIIHRGNHFNRLVLTNDAPALAIAARDEEEAINISALEDMSYELFKKNKSIEYHFNKMIVDSDQFSEEDKERARVKIEALKKQKLSEKERVSQKELKAYCIAFINASKLVREDLRKDAEIDIDLTIATINKRYPVILRARSAQARQLFDEAMQKIDSLASKKAAAIAEIQKTDHLLSLWEKVSNSVSEAVSEDEIFAALSETIFTIGQENEALEELIKKKKDSGSDKEAAQLEKEVEENTSRKKVFEKLYSLYQVDYKENVRKRLQSSLAKSKARVETWLAKKQTLNAQDRFGPPQLIQLVDDFEAVKIALDRVVQDKRQQNVPYLNPEYIMYDPYLLSHNRDVDIEYPQQISNDAWRELAQEVEREALKYLLTEGVDVAIRQDIDTSLCVLRGVLSKVNIGPADKKEAHKHTLRKRIKRVLDTLILQADEGDEARLSAYANFARLMGQNAGRCMDGVELGIDVIEQELIFSSGGGTFAEHTISKILTNDKHDFIRQHSHFGGGEEQETEVPAFLLQRMRYPLSLRGEPTDIIANPGYARHNEPDLQPAKVMERYLEGAPDIAAFEARTPEKLISLLYEAYERGVNEIKGQGQTFSNEELADFALSDVRMKPLYQIFDDGEAHESEYFEVRNNLIGYKRAFFEYMLKRLGYIIDPRDPSINILSENPQGVLEKILVSVPVELAVVATPVASSFGGEEEQQ